MRLALRASIAAFLLAAACGSTDAWAGSSGGSAGQAGAGGSKGTTGSGGTKGTGGTSGSDDLDEPAPAPTTPPPKGSKPPPPPPSKPTIGGPIIPDDEDEPPPTTTTPTTPPANGKPPPKGQAPPAAPDLLGGENVDTNAHAVGVDTADIYRAYVAKVQGDSADEELIAWDTYLQKYPNSVFKDRITTRVQALNDELYTQHIQAPNQNQTIDASKQEINLAEGFELQSIDPRTRFEGAFEWGIPNRINLVIDYQRQIIRDFSFHVGIHDAYSGWRIGGGATWAFVKSVHTGTVASLLGDVEVNANPAYPVLRPQLAIGQRFGKVDVQAQAGAEFDTRKKAGVRLLGGANVTWRAADVLGIFAETTLYMSDVSSEKGSLFFRFNTLNFGMQFYPAGGNLKPQQLQISVGASVPYTSNYWMYDYGAIMAKANYYFM